MVVISAMLPTGVLTSGKGLLQYKKTLKENLKYRAVGLGEKVRFWLNSWVGERPLATQFPDLVNCAMDREAMISSYLERTVEETRRRMRRVRCYFFLIL